MNEHDVSEQAYKKGLAAGREELKECINELCLMCGKYREEHLGACSGCKWYGKKFA